MTEEALEREQLAVQRMLASERLSIDNFGPGRTSFLSHLGAWTQLVPAPWIAHRDLIYALALANLSPTKRSSLAKSVVAEWDREFGVGRLTLRASASGLPMGGSHLHLAERSGEGPSCLYTWALGAKSQPAQCDWISLRAQPEWALDVAPKEISARGMETLVGLGTGVVIAVPSIVAARQVAEKICSRVRIDAHPRYAPHLKELIEGQEPLEGAGSLFLWPHDQLDSPRLAKQELRTLVLVSATEALSQQATRWAQAREKVEVVDARCPGRAGKTELLKFWKGCGEPKVLLRGDPAWTATGRAWLSNAGVVVAGQSKGTQLGLF